MPPAPGMSQPQAAQPQLQRAAVQRQHARRSAGQGFLPKLAPGQANPDMSFSSASPQGHPTPSSHASSPTNMPTKSPMTMHQGGMTPPTSAVIAQGQAQQYHAYPRASQQPSNPGYFQTQAQLPRSSHRGQPSHYQSSASSTASQQSFNPPMSAGRSAAGSATAASAYYPSPFQKHIDQLGKFSPICLIELCSS
jgi:hypothetical protein